MNTFGVRNSLLLCLPFFFVGCSANNGKLSDQEEFKLKEKCSGYIKSAENRARELSGSKNVCVLDGVYYSTALNSCVSKINLIDEKIITVGVLYYDELSGEQLRKIFRVPGEETHDKDGWIAFMKEMYKFEGELKTLSYRSLRRLKMQEMLDQGKLDLKHEAIQKLIERGALKVPKKDK